MDDNARAIPWHVKNYRRNLVDMHIEAWDELFMASFDPQAYVDALVKGNVSCAMVYANSHAGYCYWPSPSGNMHPGLKGRDIFGEITRLCHERGIDVILYYSVIYDNWVYDGEPLWRLRRADGTTSREDGKGGVGSRYGLICPNAEDYRTFTDRQLKSLAERYRFESVFFDMTFWPAVCYCDHCQRRWADKGMGFMPRVIDWNDARWNAFQTAREDWLNEFAFFCTDAIKRYKPGVTVNHQFSSITQGWVRGVTEKHTDACDYVGGDFYAGATEQSLICKLFRSLTGSFEFHTTRCTDLSDHTTMKSPEHIELQSRIALAHGGAFLFIDAIDPEGTLNPDIYDRLSVILKGFQAYEPYIGGELIADAAILFDMNSKIDPADNGKHVTEGSGSVPHIDAVIGAAKALKESHIPYTVIGARNLKDAINKYRVIIVPDAIRLPDEAANDLRAYVNAGGRMYASGRTGLTNLRDVLGIDQHIGETAEPLTYMAPSSGAEILMSGASAKYPLTILSAQQLVKPLPGTTTLAAITLPYTNPSDPSRFSSIHSNPPGIPTEYPALLIRSQGAGRTIWAAGSIERRGERAHMDTFVDLVKALLYTMPSVPSVVVEAPPAVEAVCFRQEDGVLVNVLNVQPALPPVTAYGVKISVNLKNSKCVEKVVLLPEGQDVPFEEVPFEEIPSEKYGRYVSFEARPLRLFDMYKIITTESTGGTQC